MESTTIGVKDSIPFYLFFSLFFSPRGKADVRVGMRPAEVWSVFSLSLLFPLFSDGDGALLHR